MTQEAMDEPASKPSPSIVELRIASARISQGKEAYETVNELIIEKKKRDVIYKNGITLPVSAEKLMAEAERKIRHSTKLGRNMATGGYKRPQNAPRGSVSSHHIVAVFDERAEPSRFLLFGWGIGINDIDNGVRLPSYNRSNVPGLPKATKHAVLHTTKYYIAVHSRLDAAAHDDPQAGRLSLRRIKKEIIEGIFPH